MTRNDPIPQQPIELTRELPSVDGVTFDAERVVLEGFYADELAPYRAKRVWSEILETNFLLDAEHDFTIEIKPAANQRFILTCHFATACARYAFWRLTNNQAPEAQYVIETAHIPQSEQRKDEFLQAPDLRPQEGTSALESWMNRYESDNRGFVGWLKKMVSSLVRDD